MRSWSRFAALGISLVSLSVAAPVAHDSTAPASLAASLEDTAPVSMPRSFPSDGAVARDGIHPLAAAGASLVLPGLGQILAGSPVKGGVTMALELGLYSSLQNIQSVQLPKLRKRVAISGPIESLYRDSVRILSVFDSLDTAGRLSLHSSARRQELSRLTPMRNAAADSAYRNREKIQTNIDLRDPELVWAIGVHAWAVVDAFDLAWHERHPIREGRSALTAGLLSAVIPGAGQIYNERWGKSAMLWMGLAGSYVSQDAHQKTLDFYQNEYALAVADGRSTTAISTQKDQFRKHRNQYYWGMGLLYFYQIIDAVVDARLDETRRPFRIGLDIAPNRLGLASALTF